VNLNRTFSLIVAIQMKFFELISVHFSLEFTALKKASKVFKNRDGPFVPLNLLCRVRDISLRCARVGEDTRKFVLAKLNLGSLFERRIGFHEMAMNCCPQFGSQAKKMLENSILDDGEDSDTLHEKASSPRKIREHKALKSQIAVNSKKKQIVLQSKNLPKNSVPSLPDDGGDSDTITPKVSVPRKKDQGQSQKSVTAVARAPPVKKASSRPSTTAENSVVQVVQNAPVDDRKPPPKDSMIDFESLLQMPLVHEDSEKIDSPLMSSFRPSEKELLILLNAQKDHDAKLEENNCLIMDLTKFVKDGFARLEESSKT